MDRISFIKDYFLKETQGFNITEAEFVDTRDSYLFSVECYKVSTDKEIDFYVFYSDILPINLYPVHKNESLDECYYKHIGFMTELCSRSVGGNFIIDFLDSYSIFPIIERKIKKIEDQITPDKDSMLLKSIANQIRECYLDLVDYLMNKKRTENVNYKKDNFKDNYQEFLKMVLPGKKSETRRNTINAIADKGWMLNSELVHKDSVTLFDVCISVNILKLLVSATSNIMVGNHMPFNRIKCPNCKSESYSMRAEDGEKDYIYVCNDCGVRFTKELKEISIHLDE